jgi:hypothetical protein
VSQILSCIQLYLDCPITKVSEIEINNVRKKNKQKISSFCTVKTACANYVVHKNWTERNQQQQQQKNDHFDSKETALQFSANKLVSCY